MRGAPDRASDAARALVGMPSELVVLVTRNLLPATQARELVRTAWSAQARAHAHALPWCALEERAGWRARREARNAVPRWCGAVPALRAVAGACQSFLG